MIIKIIKNVLRGFYRIGVILHLAFVIDYVKYYRKKGVSVGDNCRFIVAPHFWNIPDMGSEPYLISIGNHTTISFGCTFLTHDGSNWVFREQEGYKDVIIAGSIRIGDNCFIGCNSTILPDVVIGDNCIVGACSLVTKSIPSGEVWGGVPAHFISKTTDYANKCRANSPQHAHITKKNKREVLTALYMNKNYKDGI